MLLIVLVDDRSTGDLVYLINDTPIWPVSLAPSLVSPMKHALAVDGSVEICCAAGLGGLDAMGLIQGRSVDGDEGIDLHPFIAETTQAVMAGPDASKTRVDPALVREAALAAMGALTGRLDAGAAPDWPRFRLLTPHVRHVLQTVGPLVSQARCDLLLDCMTRCITSYLWSRAERMAETLAREALIDAAALGCDDRPACLRLRMVQAWAIREQFRFAEAEELFRHVFSRQVEVLPEGRWHPDVLRTSTPAALRDLWRIVAGSGLVVRGIGGVCAIETKPRSRRGRAAW